MTTTETEPTVGASLDRLHPLVRSLPGMADIDKQEAKLRRQQEFRAEAWRKANETYQREEGRHLEKVREAEEALLDKPKRHHRGAPDAIERRDEISRFRELFANLNRDRQAVLAEHADVVTAQLLDLEADDLGRAQEAVAVLDGLGPHLELLRTTLRAVNLADQRPVRTGGGRLGVVDLISAVHDGATFLQPSDTITETTDYGGGMRVTKRSGRRDSTPDDETVPEVLHHAGKTIPTGRRIRKASAPRTSSR
jgi:hypothetical protein